MRGWSDLKCSCRYGIFYDIGNFNQISIFLLYNEDDSKYRRIFFNDIDLGAKSLINHEFLTPESHIIKMLRGDAHDAQRKEVVR